MKTRLVVIALASLGLIWAAPAEAQVRVGIQFGVPVAGHHVTAPFHNAVWIRGHWDWDDFSGRNVWIEGHWVVRRPPPVVVEREWRHVPHGVARGWWKKHGGQWDARHYGDEDRYVGRDRD